MHVLAAADSQLTSALSLSLLSVAVLGAVAVSIMSIVIIRPSARGVLG